ncbi:NepR family anti-sigma factor [Yoonia sediminilitoris]|uniref:Anti-sigma factor NepR domain-containing protein n=1 Tax=Yoonia sediminilitoris TaxID=1286148 RepID=A0A2T6KB28_9RHOB|nr:NepR family anti-sigma factor [Yoonia sediminilitoris]PUB12075.1 hypothetical protein C8N45_11152 [Yoonia sediminilitoris]RCW92902.1 hypothetical protein DFP92_11151 [Yoonia sediminilitoris]
MSKAPKKPSVERIIDENLRRVYQRMVKEDVPDRFIDILNQLQQREQGKRNDPEQDG